MPQHVSAGSAAASRPGAIQRWLQVTRAQSLVISTISVLAGASVAIWSGSFRLLPLVLAWIGAVSVQAGTNLTNVYHNYKAAAGATADPRGSSAVVRFGWLDAASVRAGSAVCFGLAFLAGSLLTWLCGWKILMLGIPGVFAGYFYAAPPLRLAYLALGVITVFVFMGPVMVAGTAFAMTLHVPAAAWPVSISVGLLAAGIMHTNDLRDLDGDVQHGKRTLSTLLGRHLARGLLIAIDAAAYLTIFIAVAMGYLPTPALLVCLSVPAMAPQLRLALRATDPASLNVAWFRGIQLHLQFGVLLIAGLLLAAAL